MKKLLTTILLSIIFFIADSGPTKAQTLPGSCPDGMAWDPDIFFCVILEDPAVITCDSGSSGYCFELKFTNNSNLYCPWDCFWTGKANDYCNRFYAILLNFCVSLGKDNYEN